MTPLAPTVGVRLQGDKDRIDKTLEAISAGTKTSSKANIIGEIQIALDPNLKTFTIFGWTSQSRKISNPYDLVFNLRPTDDQISAQETNCAIWPNSERKLRLRVESAVAQAFSVRVGG